MSDLIQLPTVEQINLEHRLANSKASEAVQHATNCGLMLLQIKASKQHGEWLPWLKQQQESGAIGFSQPTASKYMKLAANYNRDFNLTVAPIIRAALELLSDKEPEAEQGTLIDVESERQAREAAEAKAEAERQARELFERRAQESQAESNERRKKVRELEEQIDLLTTRDRMLQDRLEQADQEIKYLATVVPEPEKVIVTPDDYDAAKARLATLESELTAIKKEQSKLVNDQVKAKLRERETELAEMERRKTLMEEQVERMKAYMASLDSDLKRAEVHQKVIEEQRLHLISLAAFIGDMEPMNTPETVRRWLALADMCMEAAHGIRQVFGEHRPELTVIRGDAA